MSFFGVQLNAQVNRLMLEIRLKLSQNKFAPNFRTIYRSFAKYDPQICGALNEVHFQKALNENGLFFKKFEIQAFCKAYHNEQGLVDWFSFMSHLREPMGPLRRQLVENIFDNMDTNNEQKITPQRLFEHFNPSQIEAVKKGYKSFEGIQAELLSLLNVQEGYVSKQEFIAYYDDLSINFPHNDVFWRFVSQQWNFTPEKIEACKEEQIKAALKELRFKLIQKSQGTQDQYLLRKQFEEFDRNKNHSIGTYELDLMLKKLGVPVAARLVEPMLVKLDKNCSGYIEYEEFKKFIFFDPYPI